MDSAQTASAFGELCSANVDYRDDLVRNIKTIRPSQQLFDDLSDEPDDWAIATAAEAEGRIPTATAVIARPFDYGTVITYSFDAANWQATRFSDGRRYGVWYGSLNAKTTVYETAFHWYRFLADSYPSEDRFITGERRLFDVRCEGLLVDLRGKEATYPGLTDRASYAFTQSLGSFLVDQGANGVLVKSARCDGVNGAIFRRERLSRVRDRMALSYRCNPARDTCIVEHAGGKVWLRIQPSALG